MSLGICYRIWRYGSHFTLISKIYFHRVRGLKNSHVERCELCYSPWDRYEISSKSTSTGILPFVVKGDRRRTALWSSTYTSVSRGIPSFYPLQPFPSEGILSDPKAGHHEPILPPPPRGGTGQTLPCSGHRCSNDITLHSKLTVVGGSTGELYLALYNLAPGNGVFCHRSRCYRKC